MANPWRIKWWPLPELNWGHEDFQLTTNRVSAVRVDPVCYVLLGILALGSLPLYGLVVVVYGCLLDNYLTVGEEGTRGHAPAAPSRSG